MINSVFRTKTISPGILILLAEIFLCRPLVGKSARIKSYADVSPKTSISLNQMAERYGFRSSTVNGKQITLLTKFNTILLEGGFLSNRSEAANWQNRAYLDKVARGIAEGIISYLNSVKRANQVKP